MKLPINELTEKQLDYTIQTILHNTYRHRNLFYWEIPSNVLHLIKEYKMDVRYITLLKRYGDDITKGNWLATRHTESSGYLTYHVNQATSPEIAVIRCIISSILGDEIEIPDKLINQEHYNIKKT